MTQLRRGGILVKGNWHFDSCQLGTTKVLLIDHFSTASDLYGLFDSCLQGFCLPNLDPVHIFKCFNRFCVHFRKPKALKSSKSFLSHFDREMDWDLNFLTRYTFPYVLNQITDFQTSLTAIFLRKCF